MASVEKLFKAMNLIEMASSLSKVEMGTSALTEINKAHKILNEVSLESLSDHQLKIYEKLSDKVAALQENSRESLNSCDYFEIIREKEEAQIESLIEKNQKFLSAVKIRRLNQKIKEKKFCPQYSNWNSKIYQLIEKV
jgi:hypothetical protein